MNNGVKKAKNIVDFFARNRISNKPPILSLAEYKTMVSAFYAQLLFKGYNLSCIVRLKN